jgi:penicillin-binding protein 1A
VGAAGAALAVYMGLLMAGLPDAREIVEYRPPTASRVFAYDGTLIGEFAKERRVIVEYDDIPQVLIHAFLAAETGPSSSTAASTMSASAGPC